MDSTFDSFDSGAALDICKAYVRGEEEPCLPSKKCHTLHHREFLTAIHDRHDNVSHLPLEIAGYIFELSLPEAWNSLPDVSHQLTAADASSPLVLSAVCRGWRHIAVSTPRLWATIPLMLSLSCHRVPTQCDLIKEWIHRSRGLPLSIWLTLVRPNIHPGAKFDLSDYIQSGNYWLPRITSILNNVSAQWKNIDVRGILKGIDLKLQAKSGVGSPILAGVRILDSDVALAGKILGEGEPCSPKIVSTPSERMNVKWQRVTTFEWSCSPWDEFFKMLAKCAPTVLDCNLLESTGIQRFGSFKKHLVCPKMQRLKIVQTQIRDMRLSLLALLETLELPNLLQLDFSFLTSTDALSGINDLILRSSCSLTSISLHFQDHHFIDDQEISLADMFRYTPNLIHFSLIMAYQNHNQPLTATRLFKLLTETSPAPQDNNPAGFQFAIVPNLQTFVIKGIYQHSRLNCKTIADIFGPQTNNNSPATDVQRPLKMLKIEFKRSYGRRGRAQIAANFNSDPQPGTQNSDPDSESGLDCPVFIKKKTFLRLLRIANSGVTLDIRIPFAMEINQLKLAAQYHKIDAQCFD